MTDTPGAGFVRTVMSSRRLASGSIVSRIELTLVRAVTPGTSILGVTANVWFGPGLALERSTLTPAAVALYFVTASRSPATGTSIEVGGFMRTSSGGGFRYWTCTDAVSNTGGFPAKATAPTRPSESSSESSLSRQLVVIQFRGKPLMA